MKGVDILWLPVNYRQPEAACRFCRILRDNDHGVSLDIVLVDNSACFMSPEKATDLDLLSTLHVGLFENPDNPGYFPGAARALHAYLSDHPAPRFVIVSNTDLTFADTGFMTWLVHAEWPDNILAIAPRIEVRDGGGRVRQEQNPARHEPLARAEFSRLRRIMSSDLLYGLYEGASRIAGALRRSPSLAAPGPIYMAHGSAIIFAANYFHQTAGLAFPAFLYSEEIFVAEEVRRAHGIIQFAPQLRLIHKKGQSTRGLGVGGRRRVVQQSLDSMWHRYFAG